MRQNKRVRESQHPEPAYMAILGYRRFDSLMPCEQYLDTASPSLIFSVSVLAPGVSYMVTTVIS